MANYRQLEFHDGSGVEEGVGVVTDVGKPHLQVFEASIVEELLLLIMI